MLLLQYVPYHRLKSMSREERIDVILSFLKTDRLILIDGRLDSRDEAALIRKAMGEINDGFHGLERSIARFCG